MIVFEGYSLDVTNEKKNTKSAKTTRLQHSSNKQTLADEFFEESWNLIVTQIRVLVNEKSKVGLFLYLKRNLTQLLFSIQFNNLITPFM